MAGTRALTPKSAISRLDWESDHFGLFAAQLSGPELSNRDLAHALELAREQGAQLLVWPAEGERDVPRELLDEFSGSLVDRKATFTRALRPALVDQETACPVEIPVIPYTTRF